MAFSSSDVVFHLGILFLSSDIFGARTFFSARKFFFFCFIFSARKSLSARTFFFFFSARKSFSARTFFFLLSAEKFFSSDVSFFFLSEPPAASGRGRKMKWSKNEVFSLFGEQRFFGGGRVDAALVCVCVVYVDLFVLFFFARSASEIF